MAHFEFRNFVVELLLLLLDMWMAGKRQFVGGFKAGHVRGKVVINDTRALVVSVVQLCVGMLRIEGKAFSLGEMHHMHPLRFGCGRP